MKPLIAFWFRRDLRLDDNHGLFHALQAGKPVLPVFIFDTGITDDLPSADPRVNFIHDALESIHGQLGLHGSGLVVEKGNPLHVWERLCREYDISAIYANHDYEPYAIRRDEEVRNMCEKSGIGFKSFKDQVIFERAEVTKTDGEPYTVFTPYKNKWLSKYVSSEHTGFPSEEHLDIFHKQVHHFPSLNDLGYETSSIKVAPYRLDTLQDYHEQRNHPAREGGSKIGPYLRFGLMSIRKMVRLASEKNETYMGELIWREFFMQILYHFPGVVSQSFKPKYDRIKWQNDTDLFRKWCDGTTGYPLVDAGMRELNRTGYMHNRVRMVTASFLCKHLLIDWRWGEAYFARKLLDFELSSNNGNWQWAAGTGCDAAPYFRIFNPTAQLKKFDPDLIYVKKWVPEIGSAEYPSPVVDHAFARKRALETYKSALNN